MNHLTTIILSAFCGAALAAGKPNVIVILTDDQGYGDIGAHGNPVLKTPNLDRLHAESARLTDFHVDPTCSPTRSALLTGKYPHRVKVWHTIAGGNHLRADELTMADIFRANGYRTGMFGKWHLGSNLPYRPIDRGFDEWLGQGDGGTGTTDDHFLNDRVNDHYLHNGEWEKHDGWAEGVFFDAATDFIRSSRKANQPFFIYLCTYSPHHPITLPDVSAADDYKQKVDASNRFLLLRHRENRRPDRQAACHACRGGARPRHNPDLPDRQWRHGRSEALQRRHARPTRGLFTTAATACRCFIHWPAGGLQHGEDITHAQRAHRRAADAC